MLKKITIRNPTGDISYLVKPESHPQAFMLVNAEGGYFARSISGKTHHNTDFTYFFGYLWIDDRKVYTIEPFTNKKEHLLGDLISINDSLGYF